MLMNLVEGKTSFSTAQFCKMCEKLRGLSNIIFKDSNYKGKNFHLLCHNQLKCEQIKS